MLIKDISDSQSDYWCTSTLNAYRKQVITKDKSICANHKVTGLGTVRPWLEIYKIVERMAEQCCRQKAG